MLCTHEKDLSAAWPTVLSLIVTNVAAQGKAHEQAQRVIPHQSVFPAVALWASEAPGSRNGLFVTQCFLPIDLLT